MIWNSIIQAPYKAFGNILYQEYISCDETGKLGGNYNNALCVLDKNCLKYVLEQYSSTDFTQVHVFFVICSSGLSKH